MWKHLFDLIKQLFTLTDTVDRISNEQREMRQLLQKLSDNQLRFEFELRLMKEREAMQQKIQLLEQENQQLRESSKLLPPSSEETNK
jgi:hypothetical protein